MSFATRLGPLTRELVQAIVPSLAQAQTSTLDKLSQDALKRLKSHTFLQTNHFEVRKAVAGLDERFRVNSRDDLADALKQRLVELHESASKWEAELLQLVLELSDQPIQKTRLSDLKTLLGEGQDAGASTTFRWEDMAEEDGWDQDSLLWETVDYSDASSDGLLEQEMASESELSSMLDDVDERASAANSYVIRPQESSTHERVRIAQSWRETLLNKEERRSTRKVAISELQVIHEVLFMLQGLDTTLFSPDYVVVPYFQLENMEWDTFKALMAGFGESGARIHQLRGFVSVRQDVPHLQAFQYCVSERLHKLHSNISTLQQQLTTPTPGFVLSIMRTRYQLATWLEPLCALASIVSMVEMDPYSTPFRHLEVLFRETCLAQASGNPELYEFFARIFTECFKVYLRPIRLWMDDGKLLSASDLFFVAETPNPVSLAKTWSDRYYLRQTPEGALHCPTFLRTASGSIYNAGKNVTLLKLLGKHEVAVSHQKREEPTLDYETMCPAEQELVPFSELFDVAFHRWILSKYRATSTTLKVALFQDWALNSTLDTLHNLYFMSNGSTATSFAANLFDMMDKLQTDWADGHVLTAMAQDHFASIRDPSRLTIHMDPAQKPSSTIQTRVTVKSTLSDIKVEYRLPWPLQMIVTEASVQRYQALFTLLLQHKRAVHALHKPKILDGCQTFNENISVVFYAARSKLLWFCATIQTYLTTLVLMPLDLQLRQGLDTASGIDEMIAAHDTALKAMIDQACLGKRLAPIHECILDVFDLALKLERIRTGAPDMQDDAAHKSCDERLNDLKRQINGQVRFIWSGLRGVARATGDANSARWDMLADMLQLGDDGKD